MWKVKRRRVSPPAHPLLDDLVELVEVEVAAVRHFDGAGSVVLEDDLARRRLVEVDRALVQLQRPRVIRADAGARLVGDVVDGGERPVAGETDLLGDIEKLPDGFDTRVGDSRTDSLPKNVQQKLSLARAYLKRAPIVLFDEPVNGLDFAADKLFMEMLDKLRGHATVFLVTHRPSHLNNVDKIIVMERGQVLMAGPPNEVRPRLPKNLF